MDKLQHMQVLVAVVDANGFAGAARKLNLSPSAVTRAIKPIPSYTTHPAPASSPSILSTTAFLRGLVDVGNCRPTPRLPLDRLSAGFRSGLRTFYPYS